MMDSKTDFRVNRRYNSHSVSVWMSVALLLTIALSISGCGSCSREEAQPELAEDRTRIFGTITLDESFAPLPGDTLAPEGTGVFVLDLTGGPDTLLRALTDTQGAFSGEAVFPGQGAYTLRLYRNERRMADTTMLLAHQDTVRIEGSLPRFSGAARFHSGENEAMRTLTRLERQYNRVIQIAAAGGIAQDTIPYVLDNWSSIFWEVWDNWPGTVAARIAARESLRMLEGRNDELLMKRLREYGDDEDIRMMAARFGFMSVLQRNGLDAAIAWSDSLEAESTSQETRLRIAKNRIEVLYDSSRIDQARTRIHDYESRFAGDLEADAWLAVIRRDVEELAPGMLLPSFELEVLVPVDEPGDLPLPETMTLEDFHGATTLIEVVSLADRTYQATYPQLQTFYLIFRQENVQFLTIPVEESTIAVRAFYEERGQDWPVARAGAFAETDLEERWNIYEMPVRFLIDSQGRIIRKLHGHNVNEILIELNNIINDGDIS